MPFTSNGKKSIKSVLAIVITIGLLIPLLGLIIWNAYSQFQEQKSAYSKDLDRTADIISLGASEAIWNFDTALIEPVVLAFAKDTRILRVSILNSNQQVFYQFPADDSEQKVNISKETIAVSKDVMREGSVVGRVEVVMSLAQLQKDIRKEVKVSLASGAIQLLVCLSLLILLINKTVVNKIQVLENQAVKLSRKEIDEEFKWDNKSEIGRLGQSLEHTRKELRKIFGNLEQVVEERTQTIKTILNHVNSGFFLIDRELKVAGGFTKSCYQLIGDHIKEGQLVYEFLGLDGRGSDNLKCGLVQVFDDIFPEEVTIAQLPERIEKNGVFLSLAAAVIRDQDDTIQQVLITVNDISDLEEAERQNKMNESIIRILGQKEAFAEYVVDARKLIARGMDNPEDTSGSKIVLHTLKGNSAAFGLGSLVDLIHRIEDKTAFSCDDFALVEEELRAFLLKNRDILKVAYDDSATGSQKLSRRYEVDDSQLDTLYRDLLHPKNVESKVREEVMRWIWELKKKPARKVFGSIEPLIQRLNEKLMKEVEFEFLGRELMVDPDRLRTFAQVLPHVVRNSLDHGIEPPAERGEKDMKGQLTFEVADHDFYFWKIVLSDDGRGLDLDRITQKAVASKIVTDSELSSMTETEKQMLIFEGGLSTAESVTDISGRGVGMSAVKECIEALDGKIEIDSKVGKGTTFTFFIAKKDDDSAAEKLDRAS